MKTADFFELLKPSMQFASFASVPYPLDPQAKCAIGMYISNSFGLTGSALIEATIDNINWVPMAETAVSFSGNEKKIWVIGEAAGLRRVRVSVTILSGVADFEINAGAG
jgi:hypothetical protein